MRDRSESPAAVAPASSVAGGLRLQGLGARLILAQLLVAALLLGIAWLSRARSQEAEARVLSVYDYRILPLYRLGQLADSFAVDFVDSVHKVSDASLTPEQGAERLQRVRVEAARTWKEAERVMSAPAERRLLEQARPILADTTNASAATEMKRSLTAATSISMRAASKVSAVLSTCSELAASLSDATSVMLRLATRAAASASVLSERAIKRKSSRPLLCTSPLLSRLAAGFCFSVETTLVSSAR